MSSLKDLIRKLPDSPGVYQFFDKDNQIIYIGKAKNLKKRVKDYFQKSKDKSPKTERMLEVIKDLKWIEASSEIEALTLESNLVKEHQPKFNVLLRDDKHFLYFKVTIQEDFPRVFTVRKVEKDGAKYFGPKTDSKSVQATIKLIQKLFKLRVCNLGLEEKNPGKVIVTKKTVKYPCIYQHINLCTAPCVSSVPKEAYARQVSDVLAFLSGNISSVIRDIHEKMQIAAKDKQFELAAQLRDKISAVQNSSAKQIVSDPDLASRDIVSLKVEFGKAYIVLLQVRSGKLIDQKNFLVKTGESDVPEILNGFLKQYFELTTDYPAEVLIQEKNAEFDLLEEWLNKKTGSKIKILVPQKGKKEKLLTFAEKNAAAFAIQSKAKFENATERTIGAAKELAIQLSIDREIKRIEAYDISHFSGDATVGSMVVFEKGEPKNSDYRNFKIRSLVKGEVDDYKSLAEVLRRRMAYLTEQKTEFNFRRGLKKDEEFLADKRLIDNKTGEPEDNIKDFMIAEFEDKQVACAQIHYWDKEKIHAIYRVWVDEKFRGRKLGLEVIARLLKKTKAKKVYLDCKKSLLDYYSALGFKEIRKVPDLLIQGVQGFCKLNLERKLEDQAFMLWEKKSQQKDASFLSKPDLVILDGGKGQLSSVLQSVNFPKTTQVVALAKKQEEIFRLKVSGAMLQSAEKGKFKTKKSNQSKLEFERILLPRDSQALYMVQRIRDEAHRFANSLRENIQTKNQKSSSFKNFKGVGSVTIKLLLEKFGSVENMKRLGKNKVIDLLGSKKGEKVWQQIN